ncbi:MAG: hypothetical protein OXE79_03895 [Acidimicrobiaceae bacterium]|nr:hypothetical protein [Acidimicrobiaceae bacterium]MCY4175106.1 hypothetical protein [Acidimicrobiaceae bacterium]MCY4281260.1 hypothetical protein [Acidimicrobiaceae bacterium]MCY4293242.1 hypothetical protein [Acidimicrobiaceae bacterium]
MVEVPEYLLARSKQRRTELTGDAGDDSGSPAGAAPAAASAGEVSSAARDAPVPAAPAAVAPAEPAPVAPEPVPPYVQAAQQRKRMPYWAASVMLLLPIWAIFYVGMLEPPDSDELVLADNGAVVYSTCASCHGANGEGAATGRQLNDGEVLLTFTPGATGLAEQISWVYLGTAGSQRIGLDVYGNPDRPGGQRQTNSYASGMSGFSNLGLEDLLSVVYYERLVHGGLDAETAALEEEMLLALLADDPTFETASPSEIKALLEESAEGHGVDMAAEG